VADRVCQADCLIKYAHRRDRAYSLCDATMPKPSEAVDKTLAHAQEIDEADHKPAQGANIPHDLLWFDRIR
jgi:hypothetical protein